MITVNMLDKLNQLILISLNTSDASIAKALEIARMAGAFKQTNVVFVHNQLYTLNPQNPARSLKQIMHKSA